MSELNRLIAMGGTQIPTPIQRYIQAKDQAQASQMNNLAMASDKQAMAMNNEKMQMLKQEQVTKSLASLGQYLDSVPEANRSTVFESLKPKFQQNGLPPLPQGVGYDQVKDKINQAKLEVYGVPEGTATNVMYNGTLMNAIQNKQGHYVDERTGKVLYGATKAPTRQETGEPGSFGQGSQSNQFKLNEERRVAESALYKNIKGSRELEKLVSDPDFVGGVAGDAISNVNSVAQAVKNYMGINPVMREVDGKMQIDETAIDPKSKKFSDLRKKAIAGDRYSAALIEMAYAKAKIVDPASKITDKDFDFAKKMLATGSDKASIISTLRDSSDRAWRNYNAEEEITQRRNKDYQPSLFSEDRYNELYGVQPPQGEAGNIKEMNDADILKGLGL